MNEIAQVDLIGEILAEFRRDVFPPPQTVKMEKFRLPDWTDLKIGNSLILSVVAEGKMYYVTSSAPPPGGRLWQNPDRGENVPIEIAVIDGPKKIDVTVWGDGSLSLGVYPIRKIKEHWWWRAKQRPTDNRVVYGKSDSNDYIYLLNANFIFLHASHLFLPLIGERANKIISQRYQSSEVVGMLLDEVHWA